MGRLKLVKATGSEVQRGDDGIFRLSAESQARRGSVLLADPTLRVMSGVLEGSNVNAVAAMSDMIASARRFEMQMKVISSVDDNAGPCQPTAVDELIERIHDKYKLPYAQVYRVYGGNRNLSI